MDWKSFLFSFKGRTNRLQFLCVYVLGPTVALLLMSAWLFSGPAFPVIAGALYVVFIAAICVNAWICLAAMAKRLHDRNKSAAWLILMTGVPGLLKSFDNMVNRMPAPSEGLANAAIASEAMLLLFWFWPLIELGCLPGTAGDNRYGPIPSGRSLFLFARPRDATAEANSLPGRDPSRMNIISDQPKGPGAADSKGETDTTRKKISRRVGLVVAGVVLLVLAVIGAYLIASRPTAQTAYEDLRIGMSMVEVQYVKGTPDNVIENHSFKAAVGPWGEGKEFNLILPVKDFKADQRVEHYWRWSYDQPNGSRLDLEFDRATKELNRISCYSEGYMTCAPLLGIFDGTAEEEVVAKLGEPSDQGFLDFVKQMTYKPLRVQFLLTRKKVYALTVFQ